VSPNWVSINFEEALARPNLTHEVLEAMARVCRQHIEDFEHFIPEWPALADSWRRSLDTVESRLENLS
jgi:hypothetical protein